MKGRAFEQDNRLVWKYDDELIWIESHGTDALRVRVTKLNTMPENAWALGFSSVGKAEVSVFGDSATIRNGQITATINQYGYLSFANGDGKVMLSERWQTRDDPENHMSVMYFGRDLKPRAGDAYGATVTFESNPNEKLFGMGQNQMPYLDVKGCEIELSQRNSQASIPFVLSDQGYGFFWHNPAVGKATFAKNLTKWEAPVTKSIDYWITVGNTPREIVEHYMEAVGTPDVLPEWATGLWQCKLRYRTKDELMSVAREYRDRGLPLSVIVVDFFHWTEQGDWKFDERYWPDPKGMVDELHSMGIELMVSVWPTVDPRSENYAEMKELGYLVRTDVGVRTQMVVLGAEAIIDVTNPDARSYLWEKLQTNYGQYGIRMFWLDIAEPEYTEYDFELYRYWLGSVSEVGNFFPVCYSKGVYEGLQGSGVSDPISLVRCAWAGSQNYGTVLWSGDIHSNFETLRMQVAAGLNVGLSGIPWWTTDIGGFFGGDPKTDDFRELIVRWFQFGVFCPIFRLHGYRLPTGEGDEGVDTGLFDFDTCGPNEVWEFGDAAYDIITELMFMRERIKPYIIACMEEASASGAPPMRPLFFDFPDDRRCWEIDDQLMFGPDILVAPVLHRGVRRRMVYLPKGLRWTDVKTGEIVTGGTEIDYDAPIDTVPVFVRESAGVLDMIK